MNMNKSLCFLSLGLALSSLNNVQADTIADWTFETSQPAGSGPFNPEIGSGLASGSHAGAAVYSSPVGNGSLHSFNASAWAVNDYWQFQVSTVGDENVAVSYDQTSSNTGPRFYNFSYSTDGVNFTDFSTGYTVLANALPNPFWNPTNSSSIYTYSYNLGSITALDNASAVYFRIVDSSTTSANGGVVGTTGTDRVDNFAVTAEAVPEPQGLAMVGFGGLIWSYFIRRRK